ncbi:MAG: hypothetical protein ABIL58_23345 [Pseudomonadota bacterium]
MTRDFRPTLNLLAADIRKFLQSEPTAIQGLLFRAIRSAKEATVDIADQVGTMEGSEKIIEFEDPVSAFAVEIPFDFDIDMETAGDHANDYTEEPRAMMIDQEPVPKGSVLVYDEYSGAAVVRHFWYVAHSKPISKHHGAGVIYFMMPFMDHEGAFAT